MDKAEEPPIPSMSQPDGLSDLQERVLLAIWKLSSIGQNTVEESKLKAELNQEPPQDLADATDQLHNRGFLDKSTAEGATNFSLTPLGLAILRKLEEDRLQELK